MDMEGIPDQAVDYFLEDLGDLAVIDEIERQKMYVSERLARWPERTVRDYPINPYRQKGVHFRNEGLKERSFGINAWGPPNEEGRSEYRFTYCEASPIEVDGRIVVPRKAWIHTNIDLNDGKPPFYSFSLANITEDFFDDKSLPKPVRKFVGDRLPRGSDDDAFVRSSPELFCTLDAKLRPLLNKRLISAEDIMREHCMVDDLNKIPEGLKYRLDAALVEGLPKKRMIEATRRSVARGRIDTNVRNPNMLAATLPSDLLDEARAIIRSVSRPVLRIVR